MDSNTWILSMRIHRMTGVCVCVSVWYIALSKEIWMTCDEWCVHSHINEKCKLSNWIQKRDASTSLRYLCKRFNGNSMSSTLWLASQWKTTSQSLDSTWKYNQSLLNLPVHVFCSRLSICTKIIDGKPERFCGISMADFQCDWTCWIKCVIHEHMQMNFNA